MTLLNSKSLRGRSVDEIITDEISYDNKRKKTYLKFLFEMQNRKNMIFSFRNIIMNNQSVYEKYPISPKAILRDIIDSIEKLEEVMLFLNSYEDLNNILLKEFEIFNTIFSIHNGSLSIVKSDENIFKLARKHIEVIKNLKINNLAKAYLAYLTIRHDVNINTDAFFEIIEVDINKSTNQKEFKQDYIDLTTESYINIFKNIKSDSSFFLSNRFLFSDSSIVDYSNFKTISIKNLNKDRNNQIETLKRMYENTTVVSSIEIDIVLIDNQEKMNRIIQITNAIENIFHATNMKNLEIVYGDESYSNVFKLDSFVNKYIYLNINKPELFFYQMLNIYKIKENVMLELLNKYYPKEKANRKILSEIIEVYFLLENSSFEENIKDFIKNKITLEELRIRIKLLYLKSDCRILGNKFNLYEDCYFFDFYKNNIDSMFAMYVTLKACFSPKNNFSNEVISTLKKNKINKHNLNIIITSFKISNIDIQMNSELIKHIVDSYKIELIDFLVQEQKISKTMIRKILNNKKKNKLEILERIFFNKYAYEINYLDARISIDNIDEVIDGCSKITGVDYCAAMSLVINSLKIVENFAIEVVVKKLESKDYKTAAELENIKKILKHIAKNGRIEKNNKILNFLRDEKYIDGYEFFNVFLFQNSYTKDEVTRIIVKNLIKKEQKRLKDTNIIETIKNKKIIPHLENLSDFSDSSKIKIIYEELKLHNDFSFQKSCSYLLGQFKSNLVYIRDNDDVNKIKIKALAELLDSKSCNELVDFILKEKERYSFFKCLSLKQAKKIIEFAFQNQEDELLFKEILKYSNMKEFLLAVNEQKSYNLTRSLSNLETILRDKIIEEIEKKTIRTKELISILKEIIKDDFFITNKILEHKVIQICNIVTLNKNSFEGLFINNKSATPLDIENIAISKKKIVLAIISKEVNLENDEETQKMIKNNLVKPLFYIIKSQKRNFLILQNTKHTNTKQRMIDV